METKNMSFSASKTLLHIAAYFLLFIAGDLLSSIVFDLLFSIVRFSNRSIYVLLRMFGCALVTVLLFRVYTTRVLRMKMSDFKAGFRLRGWGVAVSVLLPAVVIGAFLFIGKAEVNAAASGDAVWVVLASAMTALKAGILEEMLFRGFIMTLIEQKWNKCAAILAPSLLFGLVHIPSMEYFTVSGVLLLVISGTLVGVMFSLAAYRENSVSNSALMHTLWNFFMVTDVLHITTAAGAYGRPLFSVTIPSGNIWLTGGGFGVEASLIAVGGYLLACALIVFAKKTAKA